MTDPLLSSLCSICHIKPHKYRCPRCSTLTCSLPCIKRHKQWAQCNGVRDPTVYVKQKDLATPKGIDHDYNYLTSIEREIDNAEKDATLRGAVVGEEEQLKRNQKNKSKATKGALEKCGAIVVRAPKGMSRNKLNRTRCTKARTLRWTVEWIQLDGAKTLGECQETQPIFEAYTAHLASLNPILSANKRKRSQEPDQLPLCTTKPFKGQSETIAMNNSTHASESKDHIAQPPKEDKHLEDLNGDHRSLPSDGTQLTRAQKRHQKKIRVAARSGPKTQVDLAAQRQLEEWGQEMLREQASKVGEPQENEATVNNEQDIGKRAESADQSSLSRIEDCDPVSTSDSHAIHSNSQLLPTTTSDHQNPLSTGCTTKAEFTFYLHHPSLPSPRPVLIPLAQDETLGASLINRLVLEFPTIYVLPQQHGDKLPDSFISEDDFFATTGKALIEDVEEGELPSIHPHETAGKTSSSLGQDQVDERRLKEVLGKDIKGIQGML